MDFQLSLNKPLTRWPLLLAILLSCVGLGQLVIAHFIIGVFDDSRTTLTKAEIQAAAGYYSNSTKLQALLAQAEMTEVADHEETSARAVAAINRAVYLSPWRYDLWLLRTSAMELNGDRHAAEASLREALKLAPNNVEVHWRMANLLLRENQFEASLPHFRAAVAANPALLQSVLSLLWALSGGKAEALEAVAGNKQEAKLRLALFLLQQSRIMDAARVFSQTDREIRLRSSEAAAFFDVLVAAGEVETARTLWAELMTGKRENNWPLIWNGGFEADLAANLPQFDWVIRNSKYAAATMDANVGRNSGHSLRIDFAGLDTTTLDGELRQRFLLRPGARYRLECYVKANNFVTPEGPRLVIHSNNPIPQITATPSVPPGTYDWLPIFVEFTAPNGAKAAEVKLQRTPKYSYDDPTSGTLWLDDVSLTELGAKK